MVWGSAFCFEVTVHQIVIELSLSVHPYIFFFSNYPLLLYVSIGATSDYLPRAYDAPLAELLLIKVNNFFFHAIYNPSDILYFSFNL